MSEAVVVTAGDLKTYISKLSKLSNESLETRIATIKRKQKTVAKMLSSGKFAAAGKTGPKTSNQANYAARGLANALKWHEEALQIKSKTATASVAVADGGPEASDVCLTIGGKKFLSLWIPAAQEAEFKAKVTSVARGLGGGTGSSKSC